MKKIYTKIILSTSVFIVLAAIAWSLIYIHKQHEVIRESYYNNDCDIVYFKNGKVALWSKVAKEIVSPRVDNIFPCYHDTMSVFIQNSKYGYLNNITGNIEIPADKFDMAWDFDTTSGLAAVDVKRQIGFIDRKGHFVITPQYKYDPNTCSINIGFVNGCCILQNEDDLFGVINIHNEIVLPFIYDLIEEEYLGTRILMLNQMTGLMDSSFHIVMQPQYDDIIVTSQGIIVRNYSTNSQYMIDFDYKTKLTEYVFDDIVKIYIESLIVDYESPIFTESGYSKCYMNGLVGIIDDRTGKILIKPFWEDIDYHAPGIFKASLNDYGLFVLINSMGEITN